MKKIALVLLIFSLSIPVWAARNNTVVNVDITNADTEYSTTIPAGTREYSIQCRDATAIRIAWETGKVATPTAPYATIKASNSYTFQGRLHDDITIYFAAASGSKVVEVIYER